MAERRDFYVYLHKDLSGNVFYVGKRDWETGRGRRTAATRPGSGTSATGSTGATMS